MAGPWEQYKQPEESGPWANFARPKEPQAPGVPNPLTENPEKYTPEGLRETKPNFLTSPTGLIRTGGREILGGIEHAAQPGIDAKAEAAHEMIGGAGKALAPALIPFAAAAPIATAGAAAVGYGGAKAAEGAARYFKAPPGVTNLAGDVGGAIGGGVGNEIGGLASKAAEPLAETALGIRGAAREYGATPGRAILRDTRGVRPESVEKSAQSKIGDLTDQLESRARAAQSPINMAPARKIIQDAISTAQAGNSEPRELFPIQEHLTVPHKGFAGAIHQPPAPLVPQPSNVLGPNGQPAAINMVPGKLPPPSLATMQKPIDYLGIKRRIGEDFTNFRPGQSTPESVDTANRVYGQMARDFNSAVPGGEALNQRIQSLVPVVKRAHTESLNAGPGERLLNRVARPTGGLAPLLFGIHEGGIPGGLATMAAQETLTSPVARMLGARTLDALGRPMKRAPALAIGTRANQ